MSKGQFEPYTNNGGSVLAIAGEDFCVVAADTRQSEDCTYLFQRAHRPLIPSILAARTDCAVLATSGFHADGYEFTKELKKVIDHYKYKHEKMISTQSIAQAAANKLYSRRFFPYYTFLVLGGLDEDGRGAVFSYDPVGSFEREEYRAAGSGATLLQPFLDNQIGFKNQESNRRKITLDFAIRTAKDAFTSATERDIYTGDYLELWIITSTGVRLEKFDLKKD